MNKTLLSHRRHNQHIARIANGINGFACDLRSRLKQPADKPVADDLRDALDDLSIIVSEVQRNSVAGPA